MHHIPIVALRYTLENFNIIPNIHYVNSYVTVALSFNVCTLMWSIRVLNPTHFSGSVGDVQLSWNLLQRHTHTHRHVAHHATKGMARRMVHVYNRRACWWCDDMPVPWMNEWMNLKDWPTGCAHVYREKKAHTPIKIPRGAHRAPLSASAPVRHWSRLAFVDDRASCIKTQNLSAWKSSFNLALWHKTSSQTNSMSQWY